MQDIQSIEDLGRTVARLRRERALTQAALAQAAGISRQRLNGLESGKLGDLRLTTLFRVLAALDLTMSFQVGGRPHLTSILREREREALADAVPTKSTAARR